MSTIKANTLLHSDGSTTTQPSIPALDTRMAKAWVAFNGIGTVAIRSSYNVSSITDDGVGKYGVNFSTALTDGNYCIGAFVQEDTGGGLRVVSGYGTQTASKASVQSRNSGNTLIDPMLLSATFHR